MSVRKRGSRWQVDIHRNHRRYRMTSPSNSKEGARDYEARLLRELGLHGTLRHLEERKQKEQTLPMLEEFVPRWITNHVTANNRPKEQKLKQGVMMNHILPLLGRVRLNELTTEHIDKYKSTKVLQGLHPKTVNNHLGMLHCCLTKAQEWGLLKDVPKMKMLKAPESSFKCLSLDDLKKLHATIPDGSFRTMILLATRTGMRYCELSALRWEDVSFDEKEITIRRSIVEGSVGSTKNNRIRYMPITDEVCEALRLIQRKDGYVFQFNDRPILYKTALEWLKRYCRLAGVAEITLHQLRHSFATNLTALGVPLLSTSKLMGHADLKMTMRYSHMGRKELRSAVESLASQNLIMKKLSQDCHTRPSEIKNPA